jgi:Protein of unknown function (DUF2958)
VTGPSLRGWSLSFENQQRRGLMKLLTKDLRCRLLRNGEIRRKLDEDGEADPDFIPVVKLFTPDAGATWLLTELDPDEPDIAFGLCDLGLGCSELGYVSISELESVRGKLGLPVERDRHFEPTFTISVYARAAWTAGHIVEDRRSLEETAVAQRQAQLAAVGGAS